MGKKGKARRASKRQRTEDDLGVGGVDSGDVGADSPFPSSGNAGEGSATQQTQQQANTTRFSPQEIASAASLLSRCAASPRLLKSKEMLPIRLALEPLLELRAIEREKEPKSGGKKRDFETHSLSLESGSGDSASANERLRLMDAKHRSSTALRGARMRSLEALCDEQDGDNGRDGDGDGEQQLRLLVAGETEQQASGDSPSGDAAPSSSSALVTGVDVESLLPRPEIVRIPDGVAEVERAEIEAAMEQPARLLNFPIKCYTCKAPFRELHAFYDQLCPDCAKLNFDKRDQRADMRGMVCLVTGARVKIGFRAALKLLRCGATVIATTRFPHDATRRFVAQDDFSEWSERLHVYGADFRDIAGVERLCAAIRENFSRLDVIVNNACQTIRRPAGYYRHLLDAERQPLALGEAAERVLERNAAFHANDDVGGAAKTVAQLGSSSSGNSSIGGGDGSGGAVGSSTVVIEDLDDSDGDVDGDGDVGMSAPADTATDGGSAVVPSSASLDPASSGSLSFSSNAPSADLSQVALLPEDHGHDTSILPSGALDVNAQQVDLREHNSWTMRLHEVSTPELAEVFAINTIAPTILNARLKDMMARSGDGSDAWKFIVNVSAMEGKFYRYKGDKHPHTNMAKAALNMMTRTSAQDFRRSNIFMTAVDTGWINDEKPVHLAKAHNERHDFQTPLDEVDAASRVLDPVIQPLVDRAANRNVEPPFGIFLKDYNKCEW
jgi:NAD(P)-dependent dehydrogenase (short-subunit alcohol dehydrogenase family)